MTALGIFSGGTAVREVSMVGRASAGGTGLMTVSGTISELRPADSGWETGATGLPTVSGAVSVGVTGGGGITGAFPLFATAESGATIGGWFVGGAGMVVSVAGAGSWVSLAGARGVATWWRLGLAMEDELPAVLWLGAGLEV